MNPRSYAFRTTHAVTLLEEYNPARGPLDFFISRYFRSHPQLGSKDRAFIAETIYGLVRWQLLYEYLVGSTSTIEERIHYFVENPPEKYLEDHTIPQSVRLSCPDILFDELVESFGATTATQIARDSNYPAPTVIRVNTLKTTRDALLEKFVKSGFQVVPCKESLIGIEFQKKINFFELPEFKEGLFEVQDEASQLIADLVQAKQEQRILDFCAGSGGKTLAFAKGLQGTGQIYLHDIRKEALLEARKRLKRAGIQNAQIVHDSEVQKLSKLKKTMDWVFVDAPCSGTGTLRRNPDMKWKFSEEMLRELVGKQRHIFEKALSYLKPSGTIIYATCSVLRKENEAQVEHFLKTYPLELTQKPFQSVPTRGGKDGFFAACFKPIHQKK